MKYFAHVTVGFLIAMASVAAATALMLVCQGIAAIWGGK
jgi:hypothetical protein